jgi:hypothetical protein
VFISKEFWAARKTPVLKPTNWQHSDANIIGVIYAVEAQKLDGTLIDIENDKIPQDDFELVIHGVVYKYTFAKLAEDIENRSKNGKLFVSMEAWFSDFDYAILEDSANMKVVARNENTASLDKYLKCMGGTGKYTDKRIGRVLKDVTFGGVGIVDQPANPGSKGFVQASEAEIMEIKMAEEVKDKAAVKAALEDRAKAEQLEGEVVALKKENATASENLQRLAEKLARAEEAKSITDAILSKLEEDNKKLVPAPSAEAAKKLEDESKELVALRAKVSEFEAAKAAAEKAAKISARTSELKELLGDDETVTKLMKNLADLEDSAYAVRIDEIKTVASKARPTVRHDGAQGSPAEEGASGESKAGTIREDRKINVSASLENAKVEQIATPGATTTEVVNPFKGLASLVINKNKKEE